jgi:hypothetical protein
LDTIDTRTVGGQGGPWSNLPAPQTRRAEARRYGTGTGTRTTLSPSEKVSRPRASSSQLRLRRFRATVLPASPTRLAIPFRTGSSRGLPGQIERCAPNVSARPAFVGTGVRPPDETRREVLRRGTRQSAFRGERPRGANLPSAAAHLAACVLMTGTSGER